MAIRILSGKRPHERPQHRWLDRVVTDIRAIHESKSLKTQRIRKVGEVLVEAAMSLKSLKKMKRVFLTCVTFSILFLDKHYEKQFNDKLINLN